MNGKMITHSDDPRLMVYLGGWLAFCLFATYLVLSDRRKYLTEWALYRSYLTVPWKMFVFLPSFVFVTFAGRFTDDETWDVVTGAGMSLLTFLTAPWAIGIAFQVFFKRRAPRDLMVGVAMLFFSSSWFYDGYLFLRDGGYTTRWWSNLMLSPIVYLAAGILWNLEAKGRYGVGFGPSRADWPECPSDTRFYPLLVVAVPLMLIAAFVLVAFVRWRLP